MRDVIRSQSARVRSLPGRWLYGAPVMMLVAAGWVLHDGQGSEVTQREIVPAALRPVPTDSSGTPLRSSTDQDDPRRFRVVDDRFVEDAATGIRLPIVAGLTPSEVFARAAFRGRGGGVPLGFDDPTTGDSVPNRMSVPDRSDGGTVRTFPLPSDLRDGVGPRPSELIVGTIGVKSDITPIGVDETRALLVPSRADVVGWWSGGSVPGETGPTVLVGHYDSRTAPGVFARLKDVTTGDLIEVSQTDGTLYTYYVTEVERLSKTVFPTKRVYGRTPASTLRLVTCGGKFDRKTGHYVENTIVYAALWSFAPSRWARPTSTSTSTSSTSTSTKLTTSTSTTSTTVTSTTVTSTRLTPTQGALAASSRTPPPATMNPTTLARTTTVASTTRALTTVTSISVASSTRAAATTAAPASVPPSLEAGSVTLPGADADPGSG